MKRTCRRHSCRALGEHRQGVRQQAGRSCRADIASRRLGVDHLSRASAFAARLDVEIDIDASVDWLRSREVIRREVFERSSRTRIAADRSNKQARALGVRNLMIPPLPGIMTRRND